MAVRSFCCDSRFLQLQIASVIAPKCAKVFDSALPTILKSSFQVSRERGEELAIEYGIKFMETSAKASINVEEAFFTLARDIKCKMEKRLVSRTTSFTLNLLSKTSHFSFHLRIRKWAAGKITRRPNNICPDFDTNLLSRWNLYDFVNFNLSYRRLKIHPDRNEATSWAKMTAEVEISCSSG